MTLYRSLATALLVAGSLAATAAPAFARDQWRRDRDYDYWRHHDHGRWHGYNDRIYVYPSPAYSTPYYEESYYTAPVNTSSRVVCTREYNPLPTLLGAGAGGAIGTQIGRGSGRAAAIITGALLGGAVGSQYGYETHCAQQVFQTAPVGHQVQWRSDNAYYSVTPTREYRDEGRYCREYQSSATVGGRRSETYGTACMQPDGSWEIVN